MYIYIYIYVYLYMCVYHMYVYIYNICIYTYNKFALGMLPQAARRRRPAARHLPERHSTPGPSWRYPRPVLGAIDP